MLSMPFTKLLLVYGLMITVYFVCFSTNAMAENQQELQISPAIIDINGNKGQNSNSTVTLYNLSDKSLAITANTQLISPEDEIIDESAVERYDATSWINLPIKDFLIEPNGKKVVVVEVNVPENAEAGGHYALVVFRQINDEQTDNSNVKVSAEVGAVMLITVPGEIREQAQINIVSNSKWLFRGSTHIEYEVLNIGNLHIAPIIKTEIRDKNDKVIDTITQPTQLLLPNTKRKILIDWNNDELGKFSAHTTVSYGTPNQIVTAREYHFNKLLSIKEMFFIAVSVYFILRFLRNKKLLFPLETRK